MQRRNFVALLAFLGFCNIYAMRANLSVAIIEMQRNRTVLFPNGTVKYEVGWDWVGEWMDG